MSAKPTMSQDAPANEELQPAPEDVTSEGDGRRISESSSSSSDLSTSSWKSARPSVIITTMRTASVAVSTEAEGTASDSSEDGFVDSKHDVDHLGNKVVRKQHLPSWLINIYTYCILVSLIEFWYFFYMAYTVAVMTSIEKRYGWPSIFSGLFLASFEIGHMTIIIFSFTETNINIPRRLAIRGFFMAFGSLLAAAPHFLISIPGDKQLRPAASNGTAPFEPLFCFKKDVDCVDWANNSTSETVTPAEETGSVAITALILLVIAQIVVATASSTYHVVGIVYIDNNVDKSKSSILIGVVHSMMMLGPAAAFFFSSGVAGSVYVNPSEPNPPDPNSPAFVGAWWIGFVVCAAMFAVCAPFFFFFPMKLRNTQARRRHRQQRLSRLSSHAKSDGSSRRSSVEHNAIGNEKFTIASIPRNFVILFKNTVFLALLFMACMQTYFLAGYFTFFPKYLESTFSQSTPAANFISGIANPIPCALGTFLGGWLMSKMKLSQSASLAYTFIFTLVVCIVLMSITALRCDHGEVLGVASNNASAACGCDSCPSIYQPICVNNERTYVSPCHAGCQQGNGTNFFTCGCGSNATSSFATLGKCGEINGSSPRCFQFYLYNVAAFILAVLIFLPATPLTIIMMRVVGERYKSWSVGLTSSFSSFLGFIPGPVIYGAVFDALCLYQEETSNEGATPNSCSVRSTTTAKSMLQDAAEDDSSIRHCTVYDLDRLAFLFHAITSAFLFISLPANAYAWWVCRQREKADEEKRRLRAEERENFVTAS